MLNPIVADLLISLDQSVDGFKQQLDFIKDEGQQKMVKDQIAEVTKVIQQLTEVGNSGDETKIYTELRKTFVDATIPNANDDQEAAIFACYLHNRDNLFQLSYIKDHVTSDVKAGDRIRFYYYVLAEKDRAEYNVGKNQKDGKVELTKLSRIWIDIQKTSTGPIMDLLEFARLGEEDIRNTLKGNKPDQPIVEVDSKAPKARIEVFRVNENAKLPEKASDGSPGYKVFSVVDTFIPSGGSARVPIGFMVNVTENWYLRTHSHPELAVKGTVDVLQTLFDSHYRDQMYITLINFGKNPVQISAGDTIGQVVLEYASAGEFTEIIEFGGH